ncbi:MAG TPA: hypothetical protein VKW76_16470 [Candidatus Binatia bacterium]|nr:hypothetical protein [Candidatus Binatia bacterium]
MRIIIILLALAGWPGAACALNFFELEVYPATTEGRGMNEVENLTTFVADGRRPTEEERTGEEPRRHRLIRSSVEYNYGLTDRIDIALYTDLQRVDGQTVEYAGSRVRARGALWEQGRFPLDVGWYVEAEMPRDDPAQLEFDFRPLLSRDFGRFTVDLNPGFELPAVASERRTFEFDYAARIYWRLTRTLQPGIEFYGGIGQIRNVDPAREQEHYVFPVVYARPAAGWWLTLGPGFGLTRGSDPVMLKANVEYEFAWAW